jgi:hypothetical protein
VSHLLIDQVSDKLDHGRANRLVIALIASSELHHDSLHDRLAILRKFRIDHGSQSRINLRTRSNKEGLTEHAHRALRKRSRSDDIMISVHVSVVRSWQFFSAHRREGRRSQLRFHDRSRVKSASTDEVLAE